ncbi:MAG: hypothetical protein ACRBB0_17860 [Pelagimonas sp.]|uniref:hypothetical protein n=1 Tax=Pelagimonas sp. TaxID=2073170 RepID=UPI003D6A85A1
MPYQYISAIAGLACVLGLAACEPSTQQQEIQNSPFVAVSYCVSEQGIKPVSKGSGSLFNGNETVDESIKMLEKPFGLTTAQKSEVRRCAVSKLNAQKVGQSAGQNAGLSAGG